MTVNGDDATGSRAANGPDRAADNSGQWCKLHDCHLDDPDHLYTYPECERNLRVATVEENAARDRKAHATPDRTATIVQAAMEMHQAWMDMVNFRDDRILSSRWAEASAATEARRVVEKRYDDAFAQLTACCALAREGR